MGVGVGGGECVSPKGQRDQRCQEHPGELQGTRRSAGTVPVSKSPAWPLLPHQNLCPWDRSVRLSFFPSVNSTVSGPVPSAEDVSEMRLERQSLPSRNVWKGHGCKGTGHRNNQVPTRERGRGGEEGA